MKKVMRAFPTLMRIGFAEAVAYRAELFVWILATTMPLVMLAFWTAVAHEAPVGNYGEARFTAYFLVTFIVRQLTGSWVSWEINFEIKQGTMAMRLLRPIDPAWSYATENVAAVPLRVVAALPVAVIMLATVGRSQLTHDPAIYGAFALAVLGGWAITFLTSFAIGALAFHMESSLKVMDAWIAATFVFSGYLIPIEIFPSFLRTIADALPFRYQLGFPVELLIGAHDRRSALIMLAKQWAFVVLAFVAARLLWRSGVKRYAAFGG